MTDKEKLDKLVAEIETVKVIIQSNRAQGVFAEGYLIGQESVLEHFENFVDSMQEEPNTSVWHNANEKPIKGRKIVVLTSVCNIADKNLSFMGEYIGNGYIQAFNTKEYMNSWAKWAYVDELIKL